MLHRLVSNPTLTLLPTAAHAWAYSVALALVTCSLNLLFPSMATVTAASVVGFVLMFLMLIVTDWWAVRFMFGSTLTFVSVGSIASFGLALSFGPTAGFAAAATSWIILGVHRGTQARIILENAMSNGLAAFLSAWAFILIAGEGSLPLTSLTTTVAVILAAVIHEVVNLGTIVAGMSWDSGRPFLPLARKLSGGYRFLLSVPILGAIIPIVGSVSILALLIIPLPLAGAYLAMNALSRLQRETNATLSSLIDALELRDSYTSFHSTRVTLYVQALLNELNDLSPTEREKIVLAARVHDIGKVAVRDAVLLKPSSLTPEEWLEMQSHSAVGANLIGQLETYRPCVDVIRHHHERWDGKGYPDHLVSDQIPFGARVIAIADAFDAMTTDRPYRLALTFEEAIRELDRNRGIQFDSGLVDVFIRGLSQSHFLEIKAARKLEFSAAD